MDSLPPQFETPMSAARIIPEYSRPVIRGWSGRGIMALGLTVLIPGLGQVAAGRVTRGLIWFAWSICYLCVVVLAAFWPALVPAAGVVILLAGLTSMICWIDAFRVGARSERPMLNQSRTRFLIGWLAMAIGCLGLPMLPFALCVRQFLCEAFFVPTASMAPAVAVGDRIIVHKRVPVARWSVIVFPAPFERSTNYAKRVVGLPGETVEVENNILLIDGKPVTLPIEIGPIIPVSALQINGTHAHPMMLKSDEYFVIGDNTLRSYDSRYWPTGAPGHQPGAVPASSIIGVGTYVYWPPRHWKKLY